MIRCNTKVFLVIEQQSFSRSKKMNNLKASPDRFFDFGIEVKYQIYFFKIFDDI